MSDAILLGRLHRNVKVGGQLTDTKTWPNGYQSGTSLALWLVNSPGTFSWYEEIATKKASCKNAGRFWNLLIVALQSMLDALTLGEL